MRLMPGKGEAARIVAKRMLQPICFLKRDLFTPCVQVFCSCSHQKNAFAFAGLLLGFASKLESARKKIDSSPAQAPAAVVVHRLT
jgi:hypothetical protein